MSNMSELHAVAAGSLIHGRAMLAGYDELEAHGMSFDIAGGIAEFGISDDEIADYADFLVNEYDWDDYGVVMPDSVAAAQGLLYDVPDTSTLWSDEFDDQPPF